ncbi:TPA: hypothetical protein NVL99_003331 [Acinetobacter baumannii]|nr:hypothetical protein [Acinetobacter baumannii]HCJ7503958.1 hypothetical protein [Acinetobacter baumannii]HCJ7900289.1 hypothetical protein [Acinetobacter baumannii]
MTTKSPSENMNGGGGGGGIKSQSSAMTGVEGLFCVTFPFDAGHVAFPVDDASDNRVSPPSLKRPSTSPLAQLTKVLGESPTVRQ